MIKRGIKGIRRLIITGNCRRWPRMMIVLGFRTLLNSARRRNLSCRLEMRPVAKFKLLIRVMLSLNLTGTVLKKLMFRMIKLWWGRKRWCKILLTCSSRIISRKLSSRHFMTANRASKYKIWRELCKKRPARLSIGTISIMPKKTPSKVRFSNN